MQSDINIIIDGCLKGDPVCQHKLYKLLAPKLMAVCMRYVKARQEAEDCLQEVFIKVFSSLETYKKDGVIEAWARKIAVNILITYLKKNKVFREGQDLESVSDTTSFSSEQQNNIETRDVMALLNQLPDVYRNIFNLYVIEGFNHKEISDLTGITESSSRTYLMRAKQLLVEIHQRENKNHAEIA